MKAVFTVVLMGSFLAIAVFGVFAMNHGGNHDRGCIAAAAQGDADCPNQANPFAFLAFHFNTLKSFSTATIGPSLASVLLVAFALVFLSAVIPAFWKITPALLSLQIHSKRRQESFEFPFQRELIHWLALHENSPSVA
ncbi:MAG: hypothetical protein Q7R94_00425 [bacterium]|nr:hypothetical protein [bacterium]